MSASNGAYGFQGKLPPQNLEAEKGVIGSALLLVDAIDEIGDLKADHFYADRHRMVWQAILDLHADGVRGIDAVTLAEELDRRKQLGEIGGAEYLGELLEAVPNAAHAKYYAGIITDRWVQRNLIYTCTEVLEECYHGECVEVQELLESAEQKILSLSTDVAKKSVSSIKDVMVDA